MYDRSSISESVLSDPELLARVVRACFDSDHISEEEEIRILKALITNG